MIEIRWSVNGLLHLSREEIMVVLTRGDWHLYFQIELSK